MCYACTSDRNTIKRNSERAKRISDQARRASAARAGSATRERDRMNRLVAQARRNSDSQKQSIDRLRLCIRSTTSASSKKAYRAQIKRQSESRRRDAKQVRDDIKRLRYQLGRSNETERRSIQQLRDQARRIREENARIRDRIRRRH